MSKKKSSPTRTFYVGQEGTSGRAIYDKFEDNCLIRGWKVSPKILELLDSENKRLDDLGSTDITATLNFEQKSDILKKLKDQEAKLLKEFTDQKLGSYFKNAMFVLVANEKGEETKKRGSYLRISDSFFDALEALARHLSIDEKYIGKRFNGDKTILCKYFDEHDKLTKNLPDLIDKIVDFPENTRGFDWLTFDRREAFIQFLEVRNKKIETQNEILEYRKSQLEARRKKRHQKTDTTR